MCRAPVYVDARSCTLTDRVSVLNFVSDVRQGTYSITKSSSAGRLIALLSAAFICTHAQVDPDLWGHLRFGLDTLRTGHLSSIDPYSFTQDVPWTNHEWVSEAFTALAYQAGGVFGLVLLKAALLAAAFMCLAAATQRVDAAYRWWLLAAGIIGVATAAYTIRPQLWTLLGVPLVWHALHNRRWLPAIPLVFAVWANLHGGWIVGLGIGALWLIGRAIDRRADRPPAAEGAALAAALVATLLNPYGWRLWGFLLSTVRVSRNITEWRPVWEQADASSAVTWTVVMCVIVIPTVARRRSTITAAGALPVAALAMTSLLVSRLVPLFSEVALLGLAPAWLSAAAGAAQPRPVSYAIVDALALAAVCAFNLVPESRCLPIDDAWTPDLRAAAAFDAPAARGRLVLPFNWGEYAIWHWAPRLRVSIDGRRETVYSDSVIATQAAAARGLPEGLDYLKTVRPEYVWLPAATGARAAAWLTANGYRLDVETNRSFIAARADLPRLTIGPQKSGCFP
jgi:hypothetical protein